MATVLTPQQLAAQREKLFQQQEQATIRAAQQSAMAQRSQLQQSLSAARQDYESARLQAQEGFYQQNRDILKATSMRGLADSGQANIAEAQSQAAYGETISGLYGQKQAVEQQAVTQTQMIEQSVAAATTEANIQRATQQLQSDQQLFQEVQAIDDNKKAQMVALTEIALSGEKNAADMRVLAEAYGISQDELTTIMNASRFYDPTGNVEFKESWDWDEFFAISGTSAAAGATIGSIVPGAGTLIGGLYGALAGLVVATIAGSTKNWQPTMTVSGGGQEFSGTGAQVVQQVNSYYAGREGSDQIFAAVESSFTGTADKVVFKYKGQSFDTYNEALQAYRDSSQ